jgi:hypothetical protein
MGIGGNIFRVVQRHKVKLPDGKIQKKCGEEEDYIDP